MEGEADRLDRDLEALASRKRRKVLEHFLTADTEVTTLEVLSCKLARLNVGDGGDGPPPTERARTELHHVHLPRLADRGLVEYDAESGTVRYRSDERVEVLVRTLAEWETCDDTCER